MKKFEIIVPTYNRLRTLPRAINSILSQTEKNIGIIVVDDGSVDGTKEWLASLHDKRITAIFHSQNYGQNAALNSGVVQSTADYIGFCDSDDELLQNYCEEHLKKFSEDPDLGATYSTKLFCPNGVISGICIPFELEGNCYKEVLEQGYLSHMGTLVTRLSTIRKAGLFDLNFTNHQDDDFCFRVAKIAKIGLIKTPLAVEHTDAPNRVTGDRSDYADGFAKLIRKFYEEILSVCGGKTLIKHLLKSSDLYESCKRIDEGKNALNLALQEFNKEAEKTHQGQNMQDEIVQLNYLKNEIVKRYQRYAIVV